MDHPAPCVPARSAAEEEIPNAARSFRKAARAAGWSVETTYALGWSVTATGAVGPLRMSVALRCRRDDQRAAVVWDAAAWPVFGRASKEDADDEATQRLEGHGRRDAKRTTWTWHPPMSWHPEAYWHEGDWRPKWSYFAGWFWVAGHPDGARHQAAALRSMMKEIP